MAAVSPRGDRWLWGPVPDLLMGCGVLYGLLFLALLVIGPQLRESQALYVFPLLILLLSTPHYGATLVRVYEQRQERHQYFLFAVWFSFLVLGLFFASLFFTTLASIMVTVLLTWSPWHYTGQNYGIAMLFLKRRQVPVSEALRRTLKLSFFFSFALIFVAMNTSGGQPAATPRGYTATNVSFISLDIGGQYFSMTLAAYLGTLAAAAFLMLRVARLRDLVPATLLILSQAIWFTLPLCVIHWGLVPGIESLQMSQRAWYFIWVGLAHGLQYLWITSYFARSSRSWTGVSSYWSKTLLAGTAVWTLPVLLLAPIGIGGLLPLADYAPGYEAGFALILASGVNIHHFMLDGVIWRLRNHRIAQVLLRNEPREPATTGQKTSGRRIRGAVWSLAGLALLTALAVFWIQSFSLPAALERSDWQRAQSAWNLLDWLGYGKETDRLKVGAAAFDAGDFPESLQIYGDAVADNAKLAAAHYGVGRALAMLGEAENAIAAYLKALAVQPDFAEAHYRLGDVLAKKHRLDSAVLHYRAAIKSKPDLVSAYNNLATTLLLQGDRDQARELYREALVIDPDNPIALKNLARIGASPR